jgi:hypothetical protein
MDLEDDPRLIMRRAILLTATNDVLCAQTEVQSTLG